MDERRRMEGLAFWRMGWRLDPDVAKRTSRDRYVCRESVQLPSGCNAAEPDSARRPGAAAALGYRSAPFSLQRTEPLLQLRRVRLSCSLHPGHAGPEHVRITGAALDPNFAFKGVPHHREGKVRAPVGHE